MGKLFTRTGLAFLSAVLLGVAACSADAVVPPASSPPATSPPSTPTTAPASVAGTGSPSATRTPGETPTVETVRPEINIPEPEKYPQMANDDVYGAEAAARYALDLYGYAYESGELTAWKKLSGPDCDVCDLVIEHVEGFSERGEWIENFKLLHGEAWIYYPTEDIPAYLVRLDVLTTPYKHFDATGELFYHAPEKEFPHYAIFVQYIAPFEWKVTGIGPGEISE